MREIGYSDRVFHYKDTRDLRIRMTLADDVKPDILKMAVQKALGDFPEYAVAPVRKGNTVYYETNTRPVCFFPYDKTERWFGTEEMNYYMFCVLYEGKTFTLSMFHTLTDFFGMWHFIQNILYYYAVELGHDVPDITSPNPDIDDMERYNPYAKFQDRNAELVIPEIKREIFSIPVEKLPLELHQQHEFTITFPLKPFLAMTHEWGASAVSAMTAIISNTVANLYDAGDKEVLIKLPADMRGLLGCKTRVNFSEAVILPSSRESRELPVGEHSRLIRQIMRSQLTEGNFRKYIAIGVANARALSGEIDKPDVTAPKIPLTYAITYPGKMDLPQEYNSVVSDFELKAFVPVDPVRFSVKTTADTIRIDSAQLFDGPELVNAVAESFGQLGLKCSVQDMGRFGGNRYSLEKVRRA
ncbi:MAG: hypothetical protein IJT02_05950 [Synergistaceae bacterium]|nr:hypothetical protein [Synergistaceae bacterium]